MWENTEANENIHEYKIQLFMNTPAYLGQSIPEISKIIMYGFWYDCVKSKYWEKAKLNYMDTDSLRKNRRHLCKGCERCWNKDFIFQILN